MLEAEEVQGEPPAGPALAQLLPGAPTLRVRGNCGCRGATLRVLGVIFGNEISLCNLGCTEIPYSPPSTSLVPVLAACSTRPSLISFAEIGRNQPKAS